MSIYKFMGGIVNVLESKSGGRSATVEEFDPHEYRVIKKPTGYLDTLIHMLKGAIGAGILAMPSAVSKVGILWSTVLLAVVGLFATYCIHVLIQGQYQLCKRHRRGYMAYPKSMSYAIKDGPPFLRWSAKVFYRFVDWTLITWQIGICTVYFIFVAENLKQILAYFDVYVSVRLLLIYILVPFLVVNLIKELKMLTPLSTISNIITVLGLALIAFYLIEDDLKVESWMLNMRSITEIPIFVGTALFALEAVGVILALEYNMENPKQFGGLFGLFNISMIIIVCLYLLVGIVGFLKYQNKIEASITLNLPEGEKKAQVAKAFFTFAIFLSFPLQNFVAYSILLKRVKKRFLKCEKISDYSLRVFLVVLPWVLALASPQLGPVISLIGALCLSLLAMVFPALMNICILYGEETGYGPMKYKLIRDFFFMAVGLLILVSGVASSINEIIEADKTIVHDRSNGTLRFRYRSWLEV